MQNQNRIAPSLFSILTAFIHSLILSGIYLAYPVSEALIKLGLVNTDFQWSVIPLTISALVSIYTAIPKQNYFVRNNASIIFIFYSIVYFTCAVYDPESVKEQLVALFFISAYTVGMPLYLPIISHVIHNNSNQLAITKIEPKNIESIPLVSNDESVDNTALLDAAFVGSKYSNYYRNKFEYFDTTKKKLTWHWPAFFLTLPWFLYRKMWSQALIFLFIMPIIVTLLVYVINSIFNLGFGLEELINSRSASLLSIGIPSLVIAPLLANWLYYRHVRKNISLIKINLSNNDEQISLVTRLGGTSIVPMLGVSLCIGSIFCFYLYSIIDSLIKMKAYTSLVM